MTLLNAVTWVCFQLWLPWSNKGNPDRQSCSWD